MSPGHLGWNLSHPLVLSPWVCQLSDFGRERLPSIPCWGEISYPFKPAEDPSIWVDFAATTWKLGGWKGMRGNPLCLQSGSMVASNTWNYLCPWYRHGIVDIFSFEQRPICVYYYCTVASDVSDVVFLCLWGGIMPQAIPLSALTPLLIETVD